MLRKTAVLSLAAAAILALSASADAKPPKKILSPAHFPPAKDVLVPINPPLSGVYLASRYVACPRTGRVETLYYFDGRWANRPDWFVIKR
jgi:hypothetical protein